MCACKRKAETGRLKVSNSCLLSEALNIGNQELSGSICHNTNVHFETEEANLHPLVIQTSWNIGSYKLLNDLECFSHSQDLYRSITVLGQIIKNVSKIEKTVLRLGILKPARTSGADCSQLQLSSEQLGWVEGRSVLLALSLPTWSSGRRDPHTLWTLLCPARGLCCPGSLWLCSRAVRISPGEPGECVPKKKAVTVICCGKHACVW